MGTAAVSSSLCGFAATELDACGFVVDFSSLRPFGATQLSQQFDHTFLVNADDPLLAEWLRVHGQRGDGVQALDLRVMENVGMEANAMPQRFKP